MPMQDANQMAEESKQICRRYRLKAPALQSDVNLHCAMFQG
jgi:hypothetical protein